MPEGGHCMRKKDFDRTSELVEKNVPLTSETESCYIHMLGNANEMVRKLAFQWFLAKAEEGVSSAESVVALCYRSGIGTVRNDSRFVLWIQRAVRDGDSNAQTYLGSYLLEGIENVLPQDVTHGIQLLEQAVLQENADAMLILGRWLVEQNDGRPEQQQRGFALLQKAESAGNLDALCEVGCCLLYGVGTPANILEGVERGIDFFDCVYPSRNGRHGHVYTNAGKLNLFNAKYETDSRPIEEGCECPACKYHSRAYIRHLLKAKEMLGMRLCVLHNLYFYNTMMEEIRDAIEAGNYAEYKAKKLEGFKENDKK